MPRRSPVTIHDVARAAGVGISTVSRAFTGAGSVSPRTRERILAVAADLGYQPSGVAQSLVTHSTGTIGLVIPDIRNPYFPALARGVEDTAARYGFTVMLGNTANDPSREWTYVQALIAKRTDGVILTGTATDLTLVRKVAAAGIPIVSPDLSHMERADVVRVDQEAMAYKATSHLIAQGHRRIGHIAAPSWNRTGRERLSGYQAALKDAHLSVSSALVRSGDFHMESGELAVRELMTEPEPPTAIYAGNDLMAIGAMRELRRQGRRVPEDVAVVGHGNVPFAAMMEPPLTSMAEPQYQWGETAVTLIVNRISGQLTGPPHIRTLPFQLVIRQSCGGLERSMAQ